jgi:hypothetical protein
MVVGTLLGLFIQRYDHGPRLFYQTRYMLSRAEGPQMDMCWPDDKDSLQTTVAEILQSREIIRKAITQQDQPNLHESDGKLSVMAEHGPVPDRMFVTFKTTRYALVNGFMDALIEEYVAHRASCFVKAGMPPDEAEKQTKVVEIFGREVYQRPVVDPLGPALGAILGLIGFVLISLVYRDTPLCRGRV